jgi:hypothetical protein
VYVRNIQARVIHSIPLTLSLHTTAQFTPVTNFEEARCKKYIEAGCPYGEECNFVHEKRLPKFASEMMRVCSCVCVCVYFCLYTCMYGRYEKCRRGRYPFCSLTQLSRKKAREAEKEYAQANLQAKAEAKEFSGYVL